MNSRRDFFFDKTTNFCSIFVLKKFENPAGLSGEYFNFPTKYGDFANISKLEN